MMSLAPPILGLLLMQQPDLSLRLEHSLAPAHPVNTLATGISVAEIELNSRTGVQRTSLLYGTSPFVSPGLNVLMSWDFALPPGTALARTSITFLFRSPALYAIPIPPVAISPYDRTADRSALPTHVVDPGYPPTSVAVGAVILAVKVNAEGVVTAVEAVSGDPSLVEQSERALTSWRFAPARMSGMNVNSTAYVVISFVRPT